MYGLTLSICTHSVGGSKLKCCLVIHIIPIKECANHVIQIGGELC